jgi:DNA-binding NarL/FixJ family response regulator
LLLLRAWEGLDVRTVGVSFTSVRVDLGEFQLKGAGPMTNHPRLSEREAQILDGLAKGYANKVIARTCGITEAMVKSNIKSILRKIGVGNRTLAAIWALENDFTAAI